MITMESRIEGIKFERHKEESLITSQFLKNQKKSKTSPFLIFYLIKIIPYYNKCMLFICHEKNLLNIKTLNKSWFGLKLADPK